MTYDHVAMIPFLIDASHLSPEEVAERDANPAQWAARRYGLPEHIFRAAAERHRKESSKHKRPRSVANYGHASAASFCPAKPRLASQSIAPSPSDAAKDLQFQQPTSPQSMHTSPAMSILRTHDPVTPNASSPSGSYFSTVLSPSPSTDERTTASPPPVQRNIYVKLAQSKVQKQAQKESPSNKKKGKMRA